MYYLAVTNFKLVGEGNKESISLINIKGLLKKYSFENTLQLKCVEDGKRCFVVVDGSVQEELKEKIFSSRPEVFTYDTKLDSVEFRDLELEKLERYEVVFEYTIDKYNKAKDMIVKVDEKVYIFNSMYDKPIIKDYLSDVSDYFNDKASEVKDAF